LYSFSNKRDRTQLAVGVSKPYTYILGEEYKPDTNEVVNEWLEMYEKYMGKGGEKE
jgi:hypothetical protein